MAEGKATADRVSADLGDADSGAVAGVTNVNKSMVSRIETEYQESAAMQEALALLSTFDKRLSESEKRIERVLVRLGID